MATLFLVRHGLTAQTGKALYGRTPGISLDERGRAQAEDLASRLAPIAPTAIYASPLERCVETVEPLAQARRLRIVTRPGLLEMDTGSWTGRPFGPLRRTAKWQQIQRSPSTFSFPDGEGFAEASERVSREVRGIARRHPRGRVVVATHGDVVRLLIADLAGVPLDGFQRIVVQTASVSVVVLEKGEPPRVLLVNDTGSLTRFGPPGTPTPWETAPGGTSTGGTSTSGPRARRPSGGRARRS